MYYCRFLLAELQFDDLQRANTSLEIDHKLDTLPTTLFDTYERILAFIEKLGDETSRHAQVALRWLVLSARPLSIQELAEAVAMADSNDVKPENRLLDPKDLFRICLGLITLREDGIIQMAHFSVHEYLLSERIQDSTMALFAVVAESAHTSIIRACLNYLKIIGRKDLLLMYLNMDAEGNGYSTSTAEINRAKKVSTAQKLTEDLPAGYLRRTVLALAP